MKLEILNVQLTVKIKYFALVIVMVLCLFRSGLALPKLNCQKIEFWNDKNSCNVIIESKDKKQIMRVVVLKYSFKIRDNFFIIYRFNDFKFPWGYWGLLFVRNGEEKNIRLVKMSHYSLNMDYRVISEKTMLSGREIIDTLSRDYFMCDQCLYLREVFIAGNRNNNHFLNLIFPYFTILDQVVLYEK